MQKAIKIKTRSLENRSKFLLNCGVLCSLKDNPGATGNKWNFPLNQLLDKQNFQRKSQEFSLKTVKLLQENGVLFDVLVNLSTTTKFSYLISSFSYPLSIRYKLIMEENRRSKEEGKSIVYQIEINGGQFKKQGCQGTAQSTFK